MMEIAPTETTLKHRKIVCSHTHAYIQAHTHTHSLTYTKGNVYNYIATHMQYMDSCSY